MVKQLAPSILSADFGNLRNDVTMVIAAGAHIIHVDCMDNAFVPNLTIGPCVLESIRNIPNACFDVHLMVSDPASLVSPFADAGAAMISVHAEVDRHIHRTLQMIRSRGCQAGVVLNPGTPLNCIDEVLPWCDFILLMSVNPGFPSQKFIDTSLLKIRTLRKIIKQRKFDVLIEVDGGIKRSNLKDVLDAGADIVVAGSAIFAADDPVAEVAAFLNTLNSY